MNMHITPEVRDRLDALYQANGRLTPEMVVEEAKDKKSPLHDAFNWDVKAAAYQHWLDTARSIIRSVRLVSHEVEVITLRTPHYVRDASLNGNEQGYVSVADLRKNPDQARESLRLEFNRIQGALERARSIATAFGLDNELESMLAHLIRLREQVAA